MVSWGGWGAAPEGIAALGVDVWTADKADIGNGLEIVGSPLGKDAYVRSFSEARVGKEIAYLDMCRERYPSAPLLHCADMWRASWCSEVKAHAFNSNIAKGFARPLVAMNIQPRDMIGICAGKACMGKRRIEIRKANKADASRGGCKPLSVMQMYQMGLAFARGHEA